MAYKIQGWNNHSEYMDNLLYVYGAGLNQGIEKTTELRYIQE